VRFDVNTGTTGIYSIQRLLKFHEHDNAAESWRELASMYTSLKFTKESDLLPALVGIVERGIGRGGLDVYVAGMRKDSILDDLAFITFDESGLRADSRGTYLVMGLIVWSSPLPCMFEASKSEVASLLLHLYRTT
jgi:hypothetical protein